MKKILSFLFLFLVFHAYSQPKIQGTLKPGSNAGVIDIYLKPSASFSQKDEQMIFALAVPATIVPAPTIGSSGITDNTTGPVTGIAGLQPVFLINNLEATNREVVVSTEVISGVSHYVYIFIFAGTAQSNHDWIGDAEQLIFSIAFQGCAANCNFSNFKLVSLPNGGATQQGYWYFQANVLGDITNYPAPFYANPSTKPVSNGGSADGSALSLLEFNQQLPQCPAPSNLSAGNITGTSAALSWNAIQGTLSYTLEWKPAADATWQSVPVLTSTLFTLNGLTPGTSYEFRVTAQCSSGSSEVSAPFAFSTLCTTPTGIGAGVVLTSATLQWARVPGALSYTLQWKPATANTWTTVITPSFFYVLSGLDPGTDYEFRVATQCSNGVSDYNVPFAFSTVCTEPRFLGVPTIITATTAELHWTSNPTDLGYTFRWKLDGLGPWSPEINLTAPTYTLTGLAPGTEYVFQVSTTCGNGSKSGFITENGFATICGIPASLAASGISNSAANLNWGAVPGALNYSLQWKPAASNIWTTISNITTPSFRLTNLTASTPYVFQVSTICTSVITYYSTPFPFTTLQSFTYWRDADGDRYGDAKYKLDTSVVTPPPGYAPNNADCNDNDATVYPGAPELCDGKDNDCDGQTDEGITVTYYQDKDGDGYGGNKTKTVVSCIPPVGYVLRSGDCNDNEYTIHPGAVEICDGIDNDCDGQIDEGFNKIFYKDVDGDGYGGKTKITTCTPPAGYVAQGGDCDDNDPGVHPGAVEICFNGKDDNCNGQQDEGCIKPNITISDVSVYEAQGSIGVPVNLSSGVPWTVTVKYKAKKGTAKSPDDYTDMDGTLTIAAGLTSAQINVPIVSDNITEGDEYFILELSKPVNAEILDGVAVVTIHDGVPMTVLRSTGGGSREIVKTEEQEGKLSLSASPNPSLNNFTVIARSSLYKPVALRVLDALGRTIETRMITPNGSYSIGQNYHSGIYFVEAIQGRNKATVKLVKL